MLRIVIGTEDRRVNKTYGSCFPGTYTLVKEKTKQRNKEDSFARATITAYRQLSDLNSRNVFTPGLETTRPRLGGQQVGFLSPVSLACLLKCLHMIFSLHICLCPNLFC